MDRLYFGRFKDKTLLSLEPKGDNQIYVLAWTSTELAVSAISFADLPEDCAVARVDITNIPIFLRAWPASQDILIDRNPIDGRAKLLKYKSAIHGILRTTDYLGTPAGEEVN